MGFNLHSAFLLHDPGVNPIVKADGNAFVECLRAALAGLLAMQYNLLTLAV